MQTPLEQSGYSTWTPYQTGETWLVDLAATSERVRLFEVGKSVEGMPITGALVSHPLPLSRPGETVFVVGAQHGDEVAGREAVFTYLRDMVEDTSQDMNAYLSQAAWCFIPTLNPDRLGQRRNNANDVNLNREWHGATQPESIALMNLIATHRPGVIIDLHESGRISEDLGTYPNLYHTSSAQVRALSADLEQAIWDDLGAKGRTTVRFPSDVSPLYLSQYPGAVCQLLECRRDTADQSDPSLLTRVTDHVSALGAIRQWHEANRDAVRSATAPAEDPTSEVPRFRVGLGGRNVPAAMVRLGTTDGPVTVWP